MDAAAGCRQSWAGGSRGFRDVSRPWQQRTITGVAGLLQLEGRASAWAGKLNARCATWGLSAEELDDLDLGDSADPIAAAEAAFPDKTTATAKSLAAWQIQDQPGAAVQLDRSRSVRALSVQAPYERIAIEVEHIADSQGAPVTCRLRAEPGQVRSAAHPGSCPPEPAAVLEVTAMHPAHRPGSSPKRIE